MCKFRGQIRNETNLLESADREREKVLFPLPPQKKGRRTARPQVKMKQ